MRLIDADALIDIFEDRLEKIRNRYGDYSGEAGVCAGALHLIIVQPTIEPEQQWILCSERLPEKGFTVLVTRLTNDNITYIELASLQDDCWMSNCDEYGKPTDHKVIAWMPLPEPYVDDIPNEYFESGGK